MKPLYTVIRDEQGSVLSKTLDSDLNRNDKKLKTRFVARRNDRSIT